MARTTVEQELQTQIDELRAELRSLREKPEPANQSSRRDLLKNLGLAAAGAVAGTVAASSSADAATGDGLILGQENIADASTIVRGSGSPSVVQVLEDGSPVPASFAVLQAVANGHHQWGIGGLVRSTPEGSGPDEFPFGVVGLVRFGVPGIGVGGNGTYGGAFVGTRAQVILSPAETRDDSTQHHHGELFQQTESLWACVEDGWPGTWRKIAGASTAGQLHLVSPAVRIYDSRDGEGPLEDEAERVIDAKDGGAVPAAADGGTPAAALVNLTITDTTSDGGYLALFENGTTWPGSSTINWDAIGQAAANTTVAALDVDGKFTVRASPGGGADFVIDVLGYWL